MKVDINNLELENNGKIYTLKEVHSAEELIELRKYHKKDYVIVKIGKKLYVPFIYITGGTNFDGKTTLCIDCEKFSYCPKVIDREFINGEFTKDKYKSLMRLEKYSFITFGLETYGRFFVWRCKSFKKEVKEVKNPNIEEIYPYLKEIRKEEEAEEKRKNMRKDFI